MKKLSLLFCVVFTVFCAISCQQKEADKVNIIDENIAFAADQYGLLLESIDNPEKLLNPKSIIDGKMKFIPPREWTSGFFPGSLWYIYELTGDENWKSQAIKYTEMLDTIQYFTGNHDIGFMIGCSYGNGLRLAGNKDYKEVIIQAAKSLCTRYNPAVGLIQSWNANPSKDWEYPVIIDNMMNLELMFEATKFSGDSTFYNIAIAHADRTLAEHFRADGSSYHVIDYSMEDGSVRHRHTAQGYDHESAWSRGQAWAIYGYVVCYRETGEQKYLDQALKTFEFMRNHKNAADDLIPYWDMDAPDAPEDNPYFENRNKRDVSSASIIASALYEISTMPVDNPAQYKEYADRMMESLASPAYRAELGTNGNFLLMHSVGSIPHNSEIDVPLNYADYYFLEALKRKKDLEVD